MNDDLNHLLFIMATRLPEGLPFCVLGLAGREQPGVVFLKFIGGVTLGEIASVLDIFREHLPETWYVTLAPVSSTS